MHKPSLTDGGRSQQGEGPNKPRKPQDELTAARELLDTLPSRLKGDPGAPFQDDLLNAMAVVREHDPAAWGRTKAVLKKARVSTRDVEAAIRRRSGPQLQIVVPGLRPEPQTAGELLGADCPAPDLLIPARFGLHPNGTFELVMKDQGTVHEVVAHAPVLITERLEDIDDARQFLELAYWRSDGWERRLVERRAALDRQKIVEEAGRGLPVSSTTAAKLVSYLHDLEAENFERIPTSRIASHLGWQGKDGQLGFLCGPDRLISGPTDSPANNQRSTPPPAREGKVQGQLVVFRGIDHGDEQVAAAVRPEGTYDAWLRAVKPIGNYQRVLLGIYASFVPPLLHIIGAPNFIIDWANRTSTGKTTTLRVAASVWGNPNEHDTDSLIGSWDATRVFVERASAVQTGLPTFLDESQRANEPRDVATVLYEVAHGRGRSRGNTRSLAQTRTWNTVLLSSGETPAVSFTRDAGTRARCIEIRGHPFGKVDEQTGKMVRAINAGVHAHFGHAGPLFVQFLVDHREDWDDYRMVYGLQIEDYAGRVPQGISVDRAIVDRLAQYLAAIDLAAMLAKVALDLPWRYEAPLREIWAELVAESNQATAEERALRDVMSWARSNEESFIGREAYTGENGENIRVPPRGWAGRWDSEEAWPFVAFLPHVLAKVLQDFGYQPDAVLEGWKQRHWLDVEPGRSHSKQIRVKGERIRLVVIQRHALEEIEK